MKSDKLFYYCPRCGNTCFEDKKDTGYKCYVCEYPMIEAPHEYDLIFEDWAALNGEEEYVWEARKQRLYDEVISKSPIFDIDLYNRRDEIADEKFRKFQEMIHGTNKGNPYGVKCPYCNATNVRRVLGFSRIFSILLLGIFALGKSGKQWHCNNCGSDF